MNEFVKSESINGNRVRYTDSSGRSFIYNKGSRAWRNNNPGNIRPPKRTKLPGIIGKAGGFAVFASYELGFKAISILLKEPQYQKLSIFDAIADYAPGIENDVENYRKLLFQITKIKLETKLSSLTNEQLRLVSEAIKQVEGFQIGIINEEIPRKKILDVRKNKENLIIQYLIEGYGWIHKDKAISLVQENIIDAVVVKNHKGYIFLRSRPDRSRGNNLDP